ncbi:hemolysin activation/secretion protein [Litorivivens lipolytica]|uniref:Hemolysin activation/secretion protein n=1 Tax=Litorivivens lipolytica TaxID=1524264 RepID=A0A7W4Z4I7_9GAMM|nr:ShlB/FhaC/HecB family hemolysin secretion/activation protein [Litorivivens lipolytica]MBB3046112.1 hemolysin activation/secretion protein [Litorivivens lipolytica]
MAIDLPPIIPPQLSSAEKIEAHASRGSETINTEVSGFTLRVTGNRYLTEEQIRQIAGAAKTPSQAIRAINQAYYQSGHLLVTIYYAQRGEVIYAHVVNGKLAGVEGDQSLTSHFTPLVGDENLTVAEFERRRVLADIQANRSGQKYQISYKAGSEPDAMTLVFNQADVEDYDPTEWGLSLGNQGNRFVGRYFAGASVTHQFWNGTELDVNYESAMTEWGETNGGRSYDGLLLTLDKPTRFGLYGVELSHARYERDDVVINPGQEDTSLLCTVFGFCSDAPATNEPVVVEGETSSAALTGEQVLYATPRQRLTVSERLDYTKADIELDDGRILQEEAHAAAELGLKYFRYSDWFGKPVRWSVQGFVEKGLSTDDGTFSLDNNANNVSAGKRTAEYLLYRPKMGVKVGLTDKWSVTLDVLSQLSDGEQLPQQKQFVLGGMSTLSAYLPGTLIGDTGTYVRVKLERNGWEAFGMEFTPALFAEYGQAQFENVDGELGDTRSLSDAGLSIEGELGWDITMQFVAAAPLSDRNIGEDALEDLEVDFYWKLSKTF